MPKASNKEKIIKSLPSSETPWVKQISGKNIFHITSDATISNFYLYLETEDGFIKLNSAKNPLDFDDIIKKGLSQNIPKFIINNKRSPLTTFSGRGLL